MHDVIVIYNHPDDPAAFDAHYTARHAPLVRELPGLLEFTWGKAEHPAGPAPYYVIARMTFADAEAAAASFASPAGVASVTDLDNFAGAGATVLHVPRASAGAPSGAAQ